MWRLLTRTQLRHNTLVPTDFAEPPEKWAVMTKRLLCTAFLVLSLSSATAGAAPRKMATPPLPWLRTEGTKIVNDRGKTVRLKGLFLPNNTWGNWVWPISAQLGKEGKDSMIKPTEQDAWVLTDRDFEIFAKLKLNYVVYDVNYELKLVNDEFKAPLFITSYGRRGPNQNHQATLARPHPGKHGIHDAHPTPEVGLEHLLCLGEWDFFTRSENQPARIAHQHVRGPANAQPGEYFRIETSCDKRAVRRHGLQERDLESYLRDDTEHCALPGLEIGRGMRSLDQRLTEA
jgi:hypothetical protein